MANNSYVNVNCRERRRFAQIFGLINIISLLFIILIILFNQFIFIDSLEVICIIIFTDGMWMFENLLKKCLCYFRKIYIYQCLSLTSLLLSSTALLFLSVTLVEVEEVVELLLLLLLSSCRLVLLLSSCRLVLLLLLLLSSGPLLLLLLFVELLNSAALSRTISTSSLSRAV